MCIFVALKKIKYNMSMKKFLLLLVLLCGAIGIGHAQAPTGTIQGKPGETVSVTLSLTNPDGFSACAFQCDVKLPDGMVGLEDGGDAPVLSSPASDTHTIASHYLGNGVYRILCYSMTNADIPAGTTVTFKVQCGETISAQAYTYELDGIELADKNSVSVNSGIITQKAGDINGDGAINATDLSSLVYIILHKEQSASGDVNNDGLVNATDLSTLVYIILHKE